MAIDPSAAYPGQIDTTDPTGYPYGAARNDAVIGDGQGTPLEKGWVKDLFGFEQALLAAAGLTPSGAQEKVGLSQYLAAIKAVSARFALQIASAINWPERVAFGSAALVNTEIAIGWAPNFGGVTGGTLCLLDTAKTLYLSKDGGVNWLAVATLTNASALRPQLAYGQFDGASVMLSNATTNFYTSPDGGTWTPRTTGTVSMSGCPAYSSALNRWVFVSSANIDYATATTAGFASWTAASVPGAWTSNSGGCKRLVYSGTLFVALPVGSYNKCLTSIDGVSWTERTLPATALWTGLAYSAAEGLWMAVNSNTGNAAKSPDGVTWTSVGSGTYTIGTDLAVNGSVWVMTTSSGNYGGLAWSSDNGATWTRGPSVGNHAVATAGWKRIVSADGRLIAGHVDGTNIEVALSLRAP